MPPAACFAWAAAAELFLKTLYRPPELPLHPYLRNEKIIDLLAWLNVRRTNHVSATSD